MIKKLLVGSSLNIIPSFNCVTILFLLMCSNTIVPFALEEEYTPKEIQDFQTSEALEVQLTVESAKRSSFLAIAKLKNLLNENTELLTVIDQTDKDIPLLAKKYADLIQMIITYSSPMNLFVANINRQRDIFRSRTFFIKKLQQLSMLLNETQEFLDVLMARQLSQSSREKLVSALNETTFNETNSFSEAIKESKRLVNAKSDQINTLIDKLSEEL